MKLLLVIIEGQLYLAGILGIFEGTDEALPIYQRAAEQGHPAASLAAGRAPPDTATRVRLAQHGPSH